MKQMQDKEFAALIGMPAPDRYALFVRRVADWEEVWSLRTDNGWCLMANEDGVELIPVWPHPRFADACADAQKKEQAAKIPLEDWLDRWLPGMNRDGRQVAVFPVPGGKGIVVSPDRLKSDLLAECEQYE
jgi:hypothetical protein